jgi:O-antigen/teichoic acid export membrane protein
MFTADRLVVRHFDSYTTVGAYGFFMGIANVLINVPDVALYQFAYPRLVLLAKEGRITEFRRQLGRLAAQALAVIVACSGLAYLLAPTVVLWVDNEVYSEYQWILLPLLAVMGLYCFSLVFHWGLYGFGADKTIIVVTAIAMLMFIAVTATALYAGAEAIPAVVAGIGAASLTLVVGKGSAVALRIHRHVEAARGGVESGVT